MAATLGYIGESRHRANANAPAGPEIENRLGQKETGSAPKRSPTGLKTGKRLSLPFLARLLLSFLRCLLFRCRFFGLLCRRLFRCLLFRLRRSFLRRWLGRCR